MLTFARLLPGCCLDHHVVPVVYVLYVDVGLVVLLGDRFVDYCEFVLVGSFLGGDLYSFRLDWLGVEAQSPNYASDYEKSENYHNYPNCHVLLPKVAA